MITALVLSTLLQVHPKNKDLWWSQDLGISVMKPKGKDEWAFKADAGVGISNADFSIHHVVDEFGIDFLVQESPSNPGANKNWDHNHAKAVCDQTWEQASKSATFTEVKKKRMAETLLPRRADRGVKCWYLEMSMKNQNDKVIEGRVWSFISKNNRSLYRIFIYSDEGEYEKYKKDIDFIMATIQTYKVKK